MTPRRAFVLGGGVAGIHAALLLRERGLDVELFEARRTLGGRAFSLPRPHGDVVDNGPHVMLGAYTSMRALLARLGTEGDFHRAKSLRVDYVERGGRTSRLALSRLPAPLAMPAAMLRLRVLSLRERLSALRGLVAAALPARADETLAAWLARTRQLGAPRRFLWDPLCHAILNAPADAVSARLFLRTLRIAFGGSARRAAIWIPTRPWGEIVGAAAERALDAAGVRVHLAERVVDLAFDAHDDGSARVVGATTASGRTLRFERDDVVVAAVTFDVLHALLPPTHRDVVPAFATRPIVSVYFDGAAPLPLDDDAYLTALVGGDPFHFVYRRPGAPASRYAVLSGGSLDFEGRSVAEIEALARAQLGLWFPSVDATRGTARVAKESRATFVAATGLVDRRPPPGRVRGVDGLHVCGDWTATGLPATLEGAARSAQMLVDALPR